MYTTFSKQVLLIAFLNGKDVCTQATLLIAFVSRTEVGHILLMENLLCKISGLALMHSAITSSLDTYWYCMVPCRILHQ